MELIETLITIFTLWAIFSFVMIKSDSPYWTLWTVFSPMGIILTIIALLNELKLFINKILK